MSENDLPIYLSYVTGYIHEVKHYHDMIFTTSGFEYLYYSFPLYLNTPIIFYTILNLYLKDKIEYITLPFDINILNNNLLNDLRLEEVKYYFNRSSLKNQNKIGDWKPDYPKATNGTIETILETSAVNCQLGFAYDLMGERGSEIIHSLIQNTDRGDIYLRGNQIIQDLLYSRTKSRSIKIDHVNFINWYALNGTKQSNSDKFNIISPVILWELLISEYCKKDLSTLNIYQLKIFCDSILKSWNLNSTESTFQEWDKIVHEINKLISTKIDNLNLGIDTHNLGKIEFEKVVNDRNILFTQYKKNIESFFNTQAFGWNILYGSYPKPNIAFFNDDNLLFVNHQIEDENEFEFTSQLFYWEVINKLLTKGLSTENGIPFLEKIIFDLMKNNKIFGKDIKFWMN